MINHPSAFLIGKYRPIYLWAGPGTVRMNRLKFMDQPVDTAVHTDAHTERGARLVVNELYCNWVHLTYNWGFPPEVEEEDWQSFQQAAQAFHQAGSPVFAYIQTSNCVYAGSFRNKGWYVKDAFGKKVHYYTGRYMTCFQNMEWRDHLEKMITGAIERGADGIFFDNLWYGEQPLSLFGAWLGGAGCYCAACRNIYKNDTGHEIPTHIQPGKPESDQYIHWRTHQLSRTVTGLAAYARQIKPGVIISANDYDPVPRPSYLVFGIDLRVLSQVQDVMMIENFSLPRWDTQPVQRLANNALTVRLVRPLLREGIHLSMLSYDVGIGFDGVYPKRRYLQGIAEAAAAGCSTTIKGTEYYDGGSHTLLTADGYSSQRLAIGALNRWLESHSGLYEKMGMNMSPVGLFIPSDALWQNWHRLAPLLLGAAQTLTVAGIPWRAIYRPEDAHGLQVILAYSQAIENYRWPKAIKVIDLTQLPGWEVPLPSLVSRSRFINKQVSGVAHWLVNQYFKSRLARLIMDGFGMARLVTQTPYFQLPQYDLQQRLLAALPGALYPRVYADQPVLIETWKNDDRILVHLVNYADRPQSIRVTFDRPLTGRIVSPQTDLDDQPVSGETIEINLDIYAILDLRLKPLL
jgi:hypothetical protein